MFHPCSIDVPSVYPGFLSIFRICFIYVPSFPFLVHFPAILHEFPIQFPYMFHQFCIQFPHMFRQCCILCSIRFPCHSIHPFSVSVHPFSLHFPQFSISPAAFPFLSLTGVDDIPASSASMSVKDAHDAGDAGDVVPYGTLGRVLGLDQSWRLRSLALVRGCQNWSGQNQSWKPTYFCVASLKMTSLN